MIDLFNSLNLNIIVSYTLQERSVVSKWEDIIDDTINKVSISGRP